MGSIGIEFANMCSYLGYKVIYYSRTRKLVPYKFYNSIQDVIKNSSVISLHLNSNPTTENIINKPLIDLMEGKYFINTARVKFKKNA